MTNSLTPPRDRISLSGITAVGHHGVFEHERRVIAAYLERWTAYAPLPQLWAALEPALKLGRVNRYASWLRLLIHADDDSMRTFAPHALKYLQSVTEPVL